MLREEVARLSPELAVHVSLVEACLLRPWPGNVRELLTEVQNAAQAARADGGGRVDARHLAETAGSAFAASRGEEGPPPSTPAPGAPAPPTRVRLVAVLRRAEGNVSAAARELGVHRTQLRRWMERHGLDAAAFGKPGKAPREDG
jgi:transcriptional regulator of acetoin/glycerol metabolism